MHLKIDATGIDATGTNRNNAIAVIMKSTIIRKDAKSFSSDGWSNSVDKFEVNGQIAFFDSKEAFDNGFQPFVTLSFNLDIKDKEAIWGLSALPSDQGELKILEQLITNQYPNATLVL